MDFRAFLQSSANDIEKASDDILVEWYKEIDQTAPGISDHIRKFGKALEGGKRIRGTLVLFGYILASKTYSPELLKAAVAYEIFQTAILAHDDIIDKSPMRRGKPSLYTALGGDHYGISQAISLGDLGFFRAFTLLAESAIPEKEKNRALALFGNALHDTVVGEMLDVETAQPATVVTEEDILAIAKLKTAYYTFVGPLTLGAVLGGADDDRLRALRMFGENIGIAFQLQDDINDVFGTHESLKKEIGGDIREGKHTILFLRARKKANKKQLEVLENMYGNPNIGINEIEAVKIVFRETGALEYAESLVSKYSTKARSVIGMITKDKKMSSMLEELIEYVAKK